MVNACWLELHQAAPDIPHHNPPPRPSPVQNADGTESYLVDRLVARRQWQESRGKKAKTVYMYRVRWQGYSAAADLWLREDQLKEEGSQDHMDDYDERYPRD